MSFTVRPKEDAPVGTVIANQATIVFDVEASIDTNQVTNRIGQQGHGADVDYNTAVDAVDVQLVINEALGIETGYDCDIDGTDGVNAVDVQLVINGVLGLW